MRKVKETQTRKDKESLKLKRRETGEKLEKHKVWGIEKRQQINTRLKERRKIIMGEGGG